MPGARGEGHRQPIAGGFPVGRGEDLDDIARSQGRPQGRGFPVDFRPGGVQADFRVDAESEIQGRGSGGQGDHPAPGRKDVHFLGDQVDFQLLEEFLRVALLLEELDHFPQPVQPPVFLDQGLGVLVLIAPVGGDPVFGQGVHLGRPDLDLEAALVFGQDGRVESLVQVGLGHGDEIAEAAGDGRPALMDEAEDLVAVPDRIGDDPESQVIIDLAEIDLLRFHLLPDAVRPLDPALDLGRNPAFGDFPLQRPLKLGQGPLGFFTPGLKQRGHPEVFLGFDIAERQVFQLGLDPAHPQPVGDGRIDLHRFRGDPLLGRFGKEFQRPEIVETVRQLDEDDPHVVGHGQDDFPNRLGPLEFRRGFLDPADFRHALHERGDVLAERLPELFRGDVRVLENVVEEAGGQGGGVQVHVGQLGGHLEGVAEVRLARTPDLTLVGPGGKDRCFLKEGDFLLAEASGNLFQDIVDADHFRTDFSRVKIQPAASRMSAATAGRGSVPFSSRSWAPRP